jgi:hypothetical protein
MPPVADHLEHGKSSVVGNDRLAIDQARTNRQGVHRRRHIGEACGEVVAIADRQALANVRNGSWLCKNASPEVSRRRDLGRLSCGSIFGFDYALIAAMSG